MRLRLLLSGFAVSCAATLAVPAGSAAQDIGQNIAQGVAANPKGHYAALDSLPDWGGVWFLERSGPGDLGPQAPELKGEFLARHEAWRANMIANDGVVRRNRSNCSPPGMPRIMQLAQYPYEFLFTPGRVTVNQEAWMQTRTIWTDGRPHPEDPDPTFMGQSIGRWEGNVLVVDTIGTLDTLDIYVGTPRSSQFRMTERIGLSPDDPDILVNHIRMEDPLAFARPYEVTTRYRRDRESTLLEFQCSENDRNPVSEDGETLHD